MILAILIRRNEIERATEHLGKRCIDNQMSLNVDKCLLDIKGGMKETTSGKERQSLPNAEDLGVMANNLSWSKNYENRANRALNVMLSKVSKGMSVTANSTVNFHAHARCVVPIFTDASKISSLNKKSMKLMERVQKITSKWLLYSSES